MSENWKFETKAIRSQSDRTQNKEHSVPLYLTSSFVFETAEEMTAAFTEEIDRNIYSRYSNPNNSELIQKICEMEGAEDGFTFATGMAAIFNTFAAVCSSGDHIVSCRSVFGSTHTMFTSFLPKWGIETTYVDLEEVDKWEEAIRPETKILYIETPTNPGVDIIDLEKVGEMCKKHNILYIVDNCFATPYLQRPIEYGADLVIHSATKFIDGQGRVLGGLIAGNKELVREIYLFSRNTGPSLSPFNSWVLSKSLETLSLRMDKHCDNAMKLAQYLEGNDEIKQVKYPFLPSHPQYEIAKKQMTQGGSIVSYEVKGGIERGQRFLNAIQMCSLSSNLGDTRTIVTHPASTTHAKLSEEERLAVGILPGLIRISVGLEHVDDIIQDIQQALEASR